MASLGEIGKLASTIQTRVSEIESYMTVTGTPQASFAIDSPFEVSLPPELSQAREEVLESLTDLHARLLGPLPYFMRLMSPAVCR